MRVGATSQFPSAIPRKRATGLRLESGRLNDPAWHLSARGRSLVTTQHVRIQVDLAGPFDGPELRVHRDGFELRSIVTNRREHAAGGEERREVDLMHGAIAER